MIKKKSEQTPRPVLVAIDFSASSEQTLLWAAEAARAHEVPLLVLHVVHDPSSHPGYYRSRKKRKKFLDRIGEVAEGMMEEFVENMLEQHPDLSKDSVKTRLVAGLPVTRILEVAKLSKAQLIVMGSHGRTGLPHLLLGSNAEKVARLASIPVTIVKGPAGSPPD